MIRVYSLLLEYTPSITVVLKTTLALITLATLIGEGFLFIFHTIFVMILVS